MFRKHRYMFRSLRSGILFYLVALAIAFGCFSSTTVAAVVITWDFENATTQGDISTSIGQSNSPFVSGFVSQTGGGPVENFVTKVFVTRFFGFHRPFVELTLTEGIDVKGFSYMHFHNNNPGYPTHPSYYAQLQLLKGTDYVDVGDPVLLSDQTWGSRATTALDLRLDPGIHRFRWDPRGLAYGIDTDTEYFAIDDLVISGSPVPEPGSLGIFVWGGIGGLAFLRRRMRELSATHASER